VTERSLVLIKPDAVVRGYIGDILSRIERKGLSVAAMDMRTVTADVAAAHYAEHEGKPFYPGLIEFITATPLVALVIEGTQAIAAFRQLAGGTDPVGKAVPGSIRGDLGLTTGENLVHGSDSPESAEREIGIWFPELA